MKHKCDVYLKLFLLISMVELDHCRSPANYDLSQHGDKRQWGQYMGKQIHLFLFFVQLYSRYMVIILMVM